MTQMENAAGVAPDGVDESAGARSSKVVVLEKQVALSREVIVATERSLLGCILSEPRAYQRVGFLRPQHFGLTEHRHLYAEYTPADRLRLMMARADLLADACNVDAVREHADAIVRAAFDRLYLHLLRTKRVS